MNTVKSFLLVVLSFVCVAGSAQGTKSAPTLYDPNGCNWQEPVLLEYLNKPDLNTAAYSPILSRDRLTLLYCIRPKTDHVRRIVVAQRESLDEPFVDIRTLDELNVGKHNYNPWLSPDGKRLYYSRYEGGTTRIRMRQAVYNEATGLWQAQVTFNDIHIIGKNDLVGSLSEDELTVYYHSERDGTYKIWMATRNSINEQFRNPIRISELNVNDVQTCPRVLPDGLTVYFTAHSSGGDYDIYRATRSAIEHPFGNPEMVCISESDFHENYAFVTPEEDLLLYSNLSDLGMGIFMTQTDDLSQAFTLLNEAIQTKLDISRMLDEALQKEQRALVFLAKVNEEWDLDPHQRNELVSIMRHITLAILREEQTQRSLQDSIENLQQIFEAE